MSLPRISPWSCRACHIESHRAVPGEKKDPRPLAQLLRLGVPRGLLLRRVLVKELRVGQIERRRLLALHGWHIIARLSLLLWGSLHRVSKQMTSFFAGGDFPGRWGLGLRLVATSRTLVALPSYGTSCYDLWNFLV